MCHKKASIEDERGGSQRHVGPKVSSLTSEVCVKIGLICVSPPFLLPSLVLTFDHLRAARLLPWLKGQAAKLRQRIPLHLRDALHDLRGSLMILQVRWKQSGKRLFDFSRAATLLVQVCIRAQPKPDPEHQGHCLHGPCEYQLCSGLQGFKEVSCNHDDIRQLMLNLGLGEL